MRRALSHALSQHSGPRREGGISYLELIHARSESSFSLAERHLAEAALPPDRLALVCVAALTAVAAVGTFHPLFVWGFFFPH